MKTDNSELFKHDAAVSSTSTEHSIKGIGNDEDTLTTHYTLAAASHSGILPPPQDLAAYDKIIPNGAERLMQMAEKEQQHRFERDKNLVNENKRGQYFGFLIAFVLIGVGTWMALIGQTAVACTIFGGGAAAIIGLFIAQSKNTSLRK